MILDWYAVTLDALMELWQGFIGFIPALVGAVVILVIGWTISVGIGRLVADVLKRVKFNQIFDRGNWKQALEKADLNVDPSAFIGGIFKWVLFIVFLLAGVEVLGLTQLAVFLQDVLGYLPNVLVAALIFVVAVIISDIVEKILRAAVESTQVGSGHMVSVIVRWSIWVFAVIAILTQLQIAPVLMQTIFTGIVAVFVIAAGLSFGLGGKEVAAEVLQDVKKKLKG